MLTNLKSAAAAAIILATLTTATAHAGQARPPKARALVPQKCAITPAPLFWLVLGVGY